jgi:hypothetical protein
MIRCVVLMVVFLQPSALEAIVFFHHQPSECKNEQDENCHLYSQNHKFRD